MGETIRYAWGLSSLGDFIVALSTSGVVALEFGTRTIEVPASLRRRLPEVTWVHDEAGLATTVAKLVALIDEPGADPGLPLDMRGSDYEKKVWNMLRRIPPGQTTYYGAIAAETGTPGDARDATAAISQNPIAILVPCHRVVKKDGSLSGYRWGAARKRALLQRERRGCSQ